MKKLTSSLVFISIFSVILLSRAVAEDGNSLEKIESRIYECNKEVFGASFYNTGKFVRAGVYRDMLCVNDSMTLISKENIVDLIHMNSPKWFIGSLVGGNVEYALEVAKLIRDKGIVFVVSFRCSEVCADYIFPLAVEKHVGARAAVIWRGEGGRGSDDLPQVSRLLEQGRALLSSAGVSVSLLDTIPDGLEADPVFREARLNGRRPGWSWSPEILSERFGVKGIGVWGGGLKTAWSSKEVNSRFTPTGLPFNVLTVKP
ncbi:MAG: hypothetical protein ACIWVG_17450 [Gloeotrichia echinulata HAB0833]